MSTCRWVAGDQPRVVRDRHLTDCEDEACRGCQPCAERHCQVCAIKHVEALTCAECIGEARTDLAEIRRLAVGLPGEAMLRGAQSEAFHLAGPTADPEAWRQRRWYGYHPTDVTGEDHPLWVLGTWDLMVTKHYEHDRIGAVTVGSAADYLRRNLSELAADVDFAFDDLARDLRRCRAHLEVVLHDGEQIERGAPCLTCKRPVMRVTEAGRTSYRCERCRRTLTDNEYRLAVRAAHVAHADRLNADDMAERVGVVASTIRRWANVRRIQPKGQKPIELPPIVRSCGTDGNGRKVYRVEDVERVRDGGGERMRDTSALAGANVPDAVA